MQTKNRLWWAIGGFLMGLLVSGGVYMESRYQETLRYLKPDSNAISVATAHFKLLAVQRLKSPQSYQMAQNMWIDWAALYFNPKLKDQPLPPTVSALFEKWVQIDGTLEDTPESLTQARIALAQLPLDSIEQRIQGDFQNSILHVNSNTPDVLFQAQPLLMRYAEVTSRFRKPSL